MKQLKIFFKRLRNPSVILSIASQIVIILMLLNVDLDRNVVMGIITAVCSVLTTLGILCNPSSQNTLYKDEIYPCPDCGKLTVHVRVNGKVVCSECGGVTDVRRKKHRQ